MFPTTQNGIDESCPTVAKLPSKGNMASRCMSEDLLQQHVYDAATKRWLPLEYIPFVYDVAVSGGTQGAKTLLAVVPDNTIILDGILDIVTSFDGATGAKLALHVEGAGDILAATVFGSLGAGLVDIVPVGTAATAVKTTQERHVTATISVANMTAGKVYGFLRCLRSF